MPRKRNDEPPKPAGTILDKPMGDILHDSMIPYAEYVILERALPRVEDGLKPVQRRILYTMHELGIPPDKPHRKCARIVGDCLGKYHPHGDTSVYDAMVRMAQPFNMRGQLVDGHGNFGSIDGDTAAAMRYTEARMAPLALEMLRDIEKDTVDFSLNFDDTLREPDKLPARFPNLLVNGASGIAVGLATNMPPHNLREAVEAVIAQIDDPDITTVRLMEHLPGPDFPTGGILMRNEELLNAYATGRGRLTVRAKVEIEEEKNGKKNLVVKEIPYQVNKASMLEKILKLTEEKKGPLASISDIRDESDREGMRAVIELRKDSSPDMVLAYLYKYADLQVTFGVNMVAIAKGRPQQLTLKQIIGHYIDHQKEVVTRRTKYDLEKAKARAHILEGLMIALNDLDKALAIIRGSKDGPAARKGLMDGFGLTDIQAQAILDLRLQRLTNLEILTLRKEYEEILKLIDSLQAILDSERKLLTLIKKELRQVAEQHGDERRTQFLDAQADELPEIAKEQGPAPEPAVLLVTRAGFLKRVAPRFAQKPEDFAEDPPTVSLPTMTDKKLLLFTNYGNVYTLPAAAVPECRPKDRGALPGALLEGLEDGEALLALYEAGEEGQFLFVTRKGMVKRSEKGDYGSRRGKLAALNLREGDGLLLVETLMEDKTLLLVTERGMSIRFAPDEVPTTGRATGGVKGISLEVGDSVCAALQVSGEGELLLITDRGYAKRNLIVDHDVQGRAGKGLKTFQFQKNGANGSAVAVALWVKEPFDAVVTQKDGTENVLPTESVLIEQRFSKGKPYIMALMDNVVIGAARASRGVE